MKFRELFEVRSENYIDKINVNKFILQKLKNGTYNNIVVVLKNSKTKTLTSDGSRLFLNGNEINLKDLQKITLAITTPINNETSYILDWS